MKRTVIAILLVMALTAGCGQTAVPVAEHKTEYGAGSSTTEALSESEKIVDEKLARMKLEADAMYPSTVSYGIIDWGEKATVHEELYDFCKALPKGGDLHIHDEKVIPISRYIKVLKDYGKVYIVLDEGPQYGYLYVKDIPDNAVPLNKALLEGSLTEEELQEILVMSEKDVPNGRWISFENLFSAVMNLYNDRDLMEKLYEEGFRSCCENKVYLVELRVILFGDDADNEETFKMIRRAYYNVRDEYPEFTVRIIGVSGKNDFFDKEYAIEILRSVIRIKNQVRDEYDPEHPEDFIIGLDLVNEEDASKPLCEYKDFFESEEVASSGLKLFLHAGESLRMDNSNVIDAYMIGVSRVGHGFNLYRYPELMKKYREKNIAIEVCPISNYRLGYVSDLRLHPGFTYMQYGIPVVICSDDGLFLTAAPLTDDFYSVILAWDLDIAEIKELCKNAVRYGSLSEEREKTLMDKWEVDWDEFIRAYAQ